MLIRIPQDYYICKYLNKSLKTIQYFETIIVFKLL